jgi:hypothetical protein
MIYNDSSISELYIPLPPPLSHIRITPPRSSDLEARLIHLNTSEISDLLRNPSWPYPRTLAEERLAEDLALAQGLLDQYTAEAKHRRWFDGCPFRAIREVKEDRSGECIGELFFARIAPGDTWLDGDEPVDNLMRPAGDVGIWWTIGSKPCFTPCHSIRRPAPHSVLGSFTPPPRNHVRCPEGTPKGMGNTKDELSNHLGRQLPVRGESQDVCEEWIQGRKREREWSRSSRRVEDHTKVEVEIGRATRPFKELSESMVPESGLPAYSKE